MKAEGWTRIEEIFHDALDLDLEAREQYLSKFRSSQEALITEVRSLLEAIDSSPELLAEPAFELGLSVFERPTEVLLTGETIGPYEIQHRLGKGGMGDVYLAEDARLGRLVALKFLSAAFLNDKWANRQLVREAQAVARLDHPNICTIYGYEEIESHRFIVMQYVDGVNLAECVRDKKIDRQALPQIALEIAEAIAEAHSHGIIHRDIKPGNIMITSDGHVKVLDFGLAKFIHLNDPVRGGEKNLSQASRPGLILGTIAYMSPEQLRAEKLDFRSDIFSIGTVLFELDAGEHPFQMKSDAETISAIIDHKSPFDRANISKLPMWLRPVTKKCLEKQKDRRYQSAAELVIDLQSHRPRMVRNYRYFSSRILACFVLILATVAALLFFNRGEKSFSMVALPYVNETGDAELDYLAEGIADSLTAKLASSGRLRIKSVPATTMDTESYQDPLSIGRENGVEFVVSGNITRQNDQLILRTSVLDVADGIAIRAWNIPFKITEIPDLEEKLSEQLYAGLSIPDGSISSVNTRRRRASTENGEAFRQYLVGRYYWKKRDKENIKLAMAAFEKSIALDPGFSRPYSGLSDCYVLLNLVAYGTVPTAEAMSKARAAARQALEIDPYDAPAHTSLGVVLMKYDWNWIESEKEYRLSIQTDSDYAAAHYWYSGLLAILGRAEESIAEAKKAKELDPFSPLVDLNLARVYYYARQYDKAYDILSNPAGIAPGDKKIRYLTGLILLQKGMYRDAEKIFEEISSDNRLFASAALGYTYAKLGKREDALNLIKELRNRSKENYLPPQEIAIIYIGLKENGNAIRYLFDSFEDRHAALVSAKVEPLFDPLRREPKFLELLVQMKLN